MNLKAMLDAALSECGFPPETLYAGNQNPAARQVFDLANRELRVVSKHSWQALRKSYEITLTSSTTYSLPVDFRQLVTGSMWSEGRLRPVELPTSDEEWAYLKSRTVDGLRYRAKIIGDKLHVHDPQAGDTLRFDYIADTAATDRSGNPTERFTTDTDLFLLDDDLLIMGIIWRFKKAKGLDDWQADKLEYDAYRKSLMGTDNSARTLNFGGAAGSRINPPQMDTWDDS